jgi:hypothetical protein
MAVSAERRSREELQQAWLEAGNDTPERAHGEWPIVRMYVGQFVKLSQIRGGKNKVSQRLKESIVGKGLLNQIDSANVTEELLAEYIDFTNRTWKAETSIDDFAHQRLDDGTYQLVVGGHTRFEAIDEAEQEGLLPPREIIAKDHEVNSVMDIIALQQDENIHSTPAIERGALAAVEAYRWGLEKGQWSNTREFLARYQGPEVKSKTLRDALYFHELPRDVMMFALTGKVDMAVGIELGKTMSTLREYTAAKCGYKEEDERLLPGSEDAVLLDKSVFEELMGRVSNIAKSRMNSTAGKAHVKAWRDHMAGILAQKRGEAPAQTLDFEMVSPQQQLEIYMRGLESERDQLIAEIEKKPAADYADIISLNQRLIGRKRTEAARARMETSLKGTLSTLGRGGLNGEALADDQDAMF